MPCSHRSNVFPLLLVAIFALSGCMGTGGLQIKQTATVAVSAYASSITQGQPVTLAASVNPVLATGTVTFYDGTNAIGTAEISSVGNVAIAQLSTTFSSVGPHTITARYSGNDFFSPSNSNSITIGVYNSNLASSSVTLQASTTTPQYQTNVTLTATVSPASATGKVTFYNGPTYIGSAAVNAGVANLITSFAAGGTATVYAVYSGDYNYLSNMSNSLTLNVSGPLVTSTTLQASTSSVAIGGSVTLTATLNPANVTGAVTFYDGSASIGTANVNAGVATLNATFSAAGHVILKAVFAGNSSWVTSTSNQVALFVTGTSPDTVSLQATPSSVIIGYSATLTATVTPAAATGTVAFYDGTVELGSVSVSGGTATLAKTFMTAGSQSLTAVYSGDTTYLSSMSSAINLQVSSPGPTPTTTILNLSEYSGYTGDYVTLTATVFPAAATGQVNFYDNGDLLGSTVLSLGKAAWSQAFNLVGGNSITAVYEGDTTYSSSTSNAQDLQLSDPPYTPPTCPTDPTLCQIECPGNPICNSYCPSDPTLCAMECPGYAGCPPNMSSSSPRLKQRFDLAGPWKFKDPVLECGASHKSAG